MLEPHINKTSSAVWQLTGQQWLALSWDGVAPGVSFTTACYFPRSQRQLFPPAVAPAAEPGGSVGGIAKNLSVCRNRRHRAVVSTQLLRCAATMYTHNDVHLAPTIRASPGVEVHTFTRSCNSPSSTFTLRNCFRTKKSFLSSFLAL